MLVYLAKSHSVPLICAGHRVNKCGVIGNHQRNLYSMVIVGHWTEPLLIQEVDMYRLG